MDSRSEKKEVLPVPFEARFVRINPQTWQNGIAMQLEIFGCAEFDSETTTPSVTREEGKRIKFF